MALKQGTFANQFGAVCVEQDIAGKQPVMIDGFLVRWHSNELVPNKVAVRIDVVHSQLDDPIRVPRSAGEAGFRFS